MLLGNDQIGYSIQHSDQAMKKALGKALDILRKLRWSSAQTRNWITQIQIDTRQKMEKMKYPGIGQKLKGRAAIEKQIREITEWETDILHNIRQYMNDSSDLISQMKTLNPPLTSENLKPFIDAMQRDRLATMSILNPITDSIEQMANLRADLRQGRFPILNPAHATTVS